MMLGVIAKSCGVELVGRSTELSLVDCLTSRWSACTDASIWRQAVAKLPKMELPA